MMIGHSQGGVSVVSGRRFREDIQGLRAVAVVLVVLYHVGVPGIRGGYVGVDVFFVISGYLISGHLLESLRTTGRVDFADFYARRVRRILPAAFVVILGSTIAAVLIVPPISLPRVLSDAMASVLMVPNFVFAARETDYLADRSPSVFQHYWSLGVEEQFYLLWPVILLALYVVCRRRVSAVAVLIGILTVTSFAYGVVTTFSNQPLAFFLLPSRAWEFLFGACAGVVIHLLPQRVPTRVATIGGWIAFATIIASATFFDTRTPFPGFAAAMPVVATAALLYFGETETVAGPSALLRLRPVQFFGAISFSLYLVHWPILVLSQIVAGDQDPLQTRTKFLVGFVGATLIAWMLYRFVEEPVRRPGSFSIRAPSRSLSAAFIVSFVLVTSLIGLSAWATEREGTLGPPVTEAAAEPIKLPPSSEVAPSNILPALEDAPQSIPRMYVDGCHRDFEEEGPRACLYGNPNGALPVALFGDSHAAQWLPALQKFASTDERVEIETYTKSGCPAVEVTVALNAAPYRNCDRWRDAVLERLLKDPPAVVVLSNANSYELVGIASPERAEVWRAGLASTVSALTSAGSAVLVIADTPRYGLAPVACVAAHPRELGECVRPRQDTLDADLVDAERSAALEGGGAFVDLNDYICGPNECPVVIANLLVYRDEHHLTVPFVSYLAPALFGDLSSMLPPR